MAVRLTLLAAPLLGVTLVLLALLPPSSHVASAVPGKSPATAAPSTIPRTLPCSGQTKADGDAGRGKRDTKCTMVAAATDANKRLTPEEEEGPHMSKRAVPEGAESLSAEKRAPSSSGFFGMRGKKGGEGVGDGSEAFKRAPSSSGFFGMRGKKEDPSEGAEGTYYDPEDFESADKRAPSSSGFFGMRGKKIPMLGYAPWYRDPKRARDGMGFFGTRGKKSGDEGDYYYVGEEESKRAPSMGFFGSRGKKWDEEGTPYGWGPEEPEGPPGDKRAVQHMNFFGMRGKRDGGEAVEYEKRAPSPSGFFGMRGKKSPGLYGDEVGEWGEEKRAPNSGFFGMRGKKDYADELGDYGEAYGDAGSKRAPMGFFGMRGKKEYPGYWSEGGDKRAPMGFFGMRGKKDAGEGGSEDELDGPEEEKRAAQHLSFFGMRGKKSEEFAPADGWYLPPAEAKRGLAGAAASAWPSTSRTPSSINSLLAYLAGREAAMAEGSGWRPVRKRFRGNKKAPMGFIGMRGKKAEALSKEVWPPTAHANGEDGYEVDPKLQGGSDEEASFENQAAGDSNGSQ